MPSESQRSIHNAVKIGDVQELQKMVRSGASVNEVDEVEKFTPLHWACAVGALECLHWLLWQRADATVRTPRGWTPAHIAAIRGQDACLQALINSGVGMSSKDNRGCTPLYLSAAHGNSFSLQAILRAGVDVDSADQNGWTPVLCAAYHGRLGCVQMLNKWGAKLNDLDNNGNTAAHLAAQEGHLSVLKYLVACGPSSTHILSARNDQGETPKMLAQQFFKNDLVEYISHIEWERDCPEEVDSLAFPAHIAATQGDLDHLRMLIENGVVNINERDDHGSTLLHKASGQGHITVIQWLIEMGANMNVQNDAGETARDVARRFGQLGALRILGGEVTERDQDEMVPGMDSGVMDDVADPPYGNTEGDSVKLTDKQIKEGQARAKKKIEELERLMEIAHENYKQLGGQYSEKEKRRLREVREKDRMIEDLTSQLDYERIKREKLEAQLDEYRREITSLNAQLEQYEQYQPSPDERMQNGNRKRPPIRQGSAGNFERKGSKKGTNRSPGNQRNSNPSLRRQGSSLDRSMRY